MKGGAGGLIGFSHGTLVPTPSLKRNRHEFIGFPCEPGPRSSDSGRVIFDHGVYFYTLLLRA